MFVSSWSFLTDCVQFWPKVVDPICGSLATGSGCLPCPQLIALLWRSWFGGGMVYPPNLPMSGLSNNATPRYTTLHHTPHKTDTHTTTHHTTTHHDTPRHTTRHHDTPRHTTTHHTTPLHTTAHHCTPLHTTAHHYTPLHTTHTSHFTLHTTHFSAMRCSALRDTTHDTRHTTHYVLRFSALHYAPVFISDAVQECSVSTDPG